MHQNTEYRRLENISCVLSVQMSQKDWPNTKPSSRRRMSDMWMWFQRRSCWDRSSWKSLRWRNWAVRRVWPLPKPTPRMRIRWQPHSSGVIYTPMPVTKQLVDCLLLQYLTRVLTCFLIRWVRDEPPQFETRDNQDIKRVKTRRCDIRAWPDRYNTFVVRARIYPERLGRSHLPRDECLCGRQEDEI